MDSSKWKSTKKHNPRLVALMWFIKTTPRDRNNKPVAQVVETSAMGFIHVYLN